MIFLNLMAVTKIPGAQHKPIQIGIITKKHGVSVAMDNINSKYGKSVINLGIRSAVKEDPIAFAHIPGVS